MLQTKLAYLSRIKAAISYEGGGDTPKIIWVSLYLIFFGGRGGGSARTICYLFSRLLAITVIAEEGQGGIWEHEFK